MKSWGYIWDVFVWSGQVIRGSLPEIYHSNGNSGLPAPALVQHRSVSLPDETVCPCLETHCRHYRERNQRASWYIPQSIIILQCWILLMCNFWCDRSVLEIGGFWLRPGTKTRAENNLLTENSGMKAPSSSLWQKKTL